MKLYLDISFLNRPFDDQTVGRHAHEAHILFELIRRIKRSEYQLVHSEVLQYELQKNTNEKLLRFIAEVLALAHEFQPRNDEILLRAGVLAQRESLRIIDSLHVASAEYMQVDYLITCDMQLIKKYQSNVIVVISPTSFIKTTL